MSHAVVSQSLWMVQRASYLPSLTQKAFLIASSFKGCRSGDVFMLLCSIYATGPRESQAKYHDLPDIEIYVIYKP
jgi:hypothetical protein